MAATTGHPPPTTLDQPPRSATLADLSDLPEPLIFKILSLLPTHLAAQTSCLSRRFRHLWSALPSLYFDRSSVTDTTRFIKMVDRALLGRDSSVPLETLCIQYGHHSRHEIPFTSVVGWIDHAAYLGVGHLHLMLDSSTAARLCPHIFSIKSLESLHIKTFHCINRRASIPVNIISTRLKSLNLWLDVDSADLTRLIGGLPVLEYLELRNIDQDIIDISSLTVRTLKLDCESCRIMKLCFPKLDTMYLHSQANNLKMFQVEMPLLSKAKFHVRSLVEVPALVLRSILKSIANAIELKLSILTSVQPARTYFSCCEKHLCFPRLGSLHFSCSMCYLELFQWEMPLLRNAEIHLSHAKEELLPLLSGFFKRIANVADLKLAIVGNQTYIRCCEMQLSFPRLEYLKFSCSMCYLELFQWEMLLLRNADIHLSHAKEEMLPPLSSFLKRIANVVDLKLTIVDDQLSFPRLDYLEFSCSMCFLKLYQAEMPVLRKANIHLSYAKEEFAPQLSGFLKHIANVVDLKLTIVDDQDQVKPFHILESTTKPPLFSRLISFEVSTCCHEATIEDVISLLENCPVLSCLEICHRDPYIHANQDKKKRDWQSKLPRNSEGNFRYASFTDLHIRDEKSQVIKLLSRRLTSKKRKIELVI